MVNGLLKNKESPSSRGPAGCKARNRGSRGDAMGPALRTREGEEAAPPSSRCTASGGPLASSPHTRRRAGTWGQSGQNWPPQTREVAASACPTPCGPGGFAVHRVPHQRSQPPPLHFQDPLQPWAGGRQGRRGRACERHLAPPLSIVLAQGTCRDHSVPDPCEGLRAVPRVGGKIQTRDGWCPRLGAWHSLRAQERVPCIPEQDFAGWGPRREEGEPLSEKA